MTITTSSSDRTAVLPGGCGVPADIPADIPAQRTRPPATAHPAVAEPEPRPVPVPRQPAAVRPARVAPARPAAVRRRWPAVVGGLAAGLTLGTVGAVGAAFALAETATLAPAPTPAVAEAGLSPNVSVPGRVLTAFGDGTWQVGVDVAPGTYATRGDVEGANCSSTLHTARTGGRIAVHRTTHGRATVVLTEADGWFTTSGCATWQRVG